MINRRTFLRGTAAVTTAVAASAALAACGDDTTDDPAGASAADVDAALAAGGTIVVWAWEPTLQQVVTAFQARYPKVTVNLVNAGTSNDQYQALQNAISAGSGVPDLAQIEYFALPQFALGESLTDLTAFGADALDATFTPGPWASVRTGGGLFGLPMDSGPMALFYNKRVFDKHGITVPATWDEYLAAAAKLHAADPTAYITNDIGDAGFTTSMIWQAGGTPFTVDGTTVTIDLADAGSTRFVALWQQLISQELLAPVGSWSDGWYKGLADGSIATLVIGAWMPANLESGVAAASGDWRVAPMPQWTAGGSATSENGGSSLAIPKAGTNNALAYGFMTFATVGEGAQIRVDNGAFPATNDQLTSDAFIGRQLEYFGGQKVNESPCAEHAAMA
ncbi:extracellular solute-binding protein [Solwaraspora sp. WMMB335]|uniref:extracellular solute-binding protein n=1 Tax=Solwaraspora sp. WMMB335 TaxID=3404118 RepID=UPI003B92BFA8